MEKAVAKEICQKYLEKRAGALPERCAEALGTAVCVCLRRRNASLEEVSLALSWASLLGDACVCLPRARWA